MNQPIYLVSGSELLSQERLSEDSIEIDRDILHLIGMAMSQEKYKLQLSLMKMSNTEPIQILNWINENIDNICDDFMRMIDENAKSSKKEL